MHATKIRREEDTELEPRFDDETFGCLQWLDDLSEDTHIFDNSFPNNLSSSHPPNY
jgi:hypothetical protein